MLLKFSENVWWVWQMRREQNLHREFAVKDVQVLQGLQQQLRMYVAKLRTMLEALRKARSTTSCMGYWPNLPLLFGQASA